MIHRFGGFEGGGVVVGGCVFWWLDGKERLDRASFEGCNGLVASKLETGHVWCDWVPIEVDFLPGVGGASFELSLQRHGGLFQPLFSQFLLPDADRHAAVQPLECGTRLGC